jgi:hypothetical protein
MKDTSSSHQKIQSLCDCFATTDPLKEMCEIKNDADTNEAALKWIALAVLHGINNNAEEVAISTSKDGRVRVTAEYRKTELPSPGSIVAEKIIKAIRTVAGIEEAHEKATIAFGVRNTSMDLRIKSRHEGSDDKITIVFP